MTGFPQTRFQGGRRGDTRRTRPITLRRLKRIEGQVRGIARMVDGDRYCIDILTQVSAVTKALQAVSLGFMEEHLLALCGRRLLRG